MPTIVASTLIDRASVALQDPTNIRWPRPEHLTALNAGQRALVLFKPNAYTRSVVRQLAAGTRQTLPDDALGLIDVPRNMGTSGITPGTAIRVARREILDAQLPNWHTSPPNTAVKHFMYTALDQKNFYVWPPQPATGQGRVELIYPASPANIAETDVLLVDDIYEDALLNYMLFRAYSKDTEYAANVQLAAQYYGAFKELLTGKTSAESAVNPNATATGNPNA